MSEGRLDAALKLFAHRDQVEVVYRCFELDPDMERNVDYDYYDKLSREYEISRKQAIDACNNVKRQAQVIGLDFQYDTMIVTNTFDAHRLAVYAAKHGKMLEMSERLFRAYFTESKHIGDHKTLTELAAEVGLDPTDVARMLASDEFAKEVRADEEKAKLMQVRGVPLFVFNGKYVISGAQPSEVFLNALNKVWQEESPLIPLGQEGEVCDENGCRIPGQKE